MRVVFMAIFFIHDCHPFAELPGRWGFQQLEGQEEICKRDAPVFRSLRRSSLPRIVMVDDPSLQSRKTDRSWNRNLYRAR
jgi:hypothetical protein